MTGVGWSSPPSVGYAYFDTENLFPAARARPAPSDARGLEAETVDPDRSRATEATNTAAWIGRQTVRILTWFQEVSERKVVFLYSAGKQSDPAVRGLLTAVRAEQRPDSSRWDGRTASGTPVRHWMVGGGENLAEDLLIKRFEADLGIVAPGTAFLVGSADDRMLTAFDRAAARFADDAAFSMWIDVWAVLPTLDDPKKRWNVAEKFGRLGVYSHIPHENARLTAELPSAKERGEQARTLRERENSERIRERRFSTADRLAGSIDPEDEWHPSDIAAVLATGLSILPHALERSPMDAPRWLAAVGEPAVVDAVRAELTVVAGPGEVDPFKRGALPGAQALQVIWRCHVYHVLKTIPSATPPVRRFLAHLAPRERWRYHLALAALDSLIVQGLLPAEPEVPAC